MTPIPNQRTPSHALQRTGVAELGVVGRRYTAPMKFAQTALLLFCGVLIGTLGTIIVLKRKPDEEAAAFKTRAYDYARLIRRDLETVDLATQQWAQLNGKPDHYPVTPKQIAKQFLVSQLREDALNDQLRDLLGNPIYITATDEFPSLSHATFETLSSVVPIEFWSPFTIK